MWFRPVSPPHGVSWMGKMRALVVRLAGIAEIGSKRLDVVTEGTFIDKGKRLKVVAVEGNRVVVRETETAT